MNERMKKLFEECSELAKDKNINIVLPAMGTPPTMMVGGTEYHNGDMVMVKVVKGRGPASGQYIFETPELRKAKELEIPYEVYQTFKLCAVGVSINHSLSPSEFLNYLLERIEYNKGNWLMFLNIPKPETIVHRSSILMLLSRAVYLAYRQVHNPEMSFKLTSGHALKIHKLSLAYQAKVDQIFEMTGNNSYITYETVEEMVPMVLTDEPIDINKFFFTMQPGSTINLS